MGIRQEKARSLIKDLAGSFIREKAGPGAIVSVTNVDISSDLKNAIIFVSIYPDEKEKETFSKIKSDLGELRSYVKSKMKSKFIPYFDIKIDKGEKNRQKIERILNG